MSRRIFRDVEEALSREVRRITFHESRTVDQIVLQDTFDPFTGELVQMPIEANFYDSSADTKNIQYPHIFVRLLKTKEDLTSGRVVPQYGQWIKTPIKGSPTAYKIITSSTDGVISAAGNDLETTLFQIGMVEAGQLLRLTKGNNIGTYIIDSVTKSDTDPHIITVKQELILDLPEANFDVGSRTLTFLSQVDLNTVKPGDNFIDSLSASFPITSIDTDSNSIVLGGVGSPSVLASGTISRTGNVFQLADPDLVRFLVLDPNQPIQVPGLCGTGGANEQVSGLSPEIPIDAYYMIRIDSKERDSHIDVLNRMWEEFNPPRTGLPVIRRSALSAEEALTVDVTSGGSSTITVGSNSDFNINDIVFIFDDIIPTKNSEGKFSRPFESTIIGKISSNQLVLKDIVPDTFTVANNAKVVSNAVFQLLMFHFVDHNTKDVEGSQYWVHEFVFWVQIFVDRLEDPQTSSLVTEIKTPVGILETETIIIDDP